MYKDKGLDLDKLEKGLDLDKLEKGLDLDKDVTWVKSFLFAFHVLSVVSVIYALRHINALSFNEFYDLYNFFVTDI